MTYGTYQLEPVGPHYTLTGHLDIHAKALACIACASRRSLCGKLCILCAQKRRRWAAICIRWTLRRAAARDCCAAYRAQISGLGVCSECGYSPRTGLSNATDSLESTTGCERACVCGCGVAGHDGAGRRHLSAAWPRDARRPALPRHTAFS